MAAIAQSERSSTLMESGTIPEKKEKDLESQSSDFETGTSTPNGPTEPPPLTFPEGGLRAWSVVLGAALLSFSTFGFTNAWGVFQEYYQRTLLKNETSSNIAWIGSVQYALVFFPGVVSGRLTDRGHLHGVVIIASIVYIAAVFLTGQCKEYWQFMLCQGIALGLPAGFIFGPFGVIVAHWFKERRALAYGVVATGTSAGGLVFPIAVRKLLPQVGFPWTMRIVGFILIFTLTGALLLIKLRLPPSNVKGGMFNFPVFKNAAFTIYSIGTFIGFLGIYTVLTYIDVAAAQTGINPDTAFYLVAIANGTSAFGRLAAAWCAVHYGAMNVWIPCTVLAGILTWAWPYINQTASFAGIVVLAIFYGASSGAFMGVAATPMAHPAFGEQGDIGRRIGMLWTICAIGALIGPPISGAINTSENGWTGVGWYAGAMAMLGAVLVVIARRLALKSWRGKI